MSGIKKTKADFAILFVDDEEKAVKYFQKFFGQEFDILSANNVKDALLVLEKRSGDIAMVISDQRMPKETGVKLLNEVKEKYPNIVRILTTAYADLEDNIAAINESRIFAYLTKPWEVDNVRTTLYNALSEFKTRLALLSLSGSIAHEVRNPLGSINLSLHQIEDHIQTKQKDGQVNLNENDVQKARNMINDAHKSIKRANEIINITLNDLKGNKPSRKDFAYLKIEEIIQKAVEEYGYNSEKQKSKIIIGKIEDFIFQGDETLAIYILFNLIKNALYYTDQYPQSTITISSKKDVDGFNRLIVEDKGPGIENNKLESIFRSFFTSGKKSGTGLGLSFCKRTMETFGGNIKCQSELEKYTRFTLYFPILQEKDLEKAQKQFESGEPFNKSPIKKVLVVDDQKTNLIATKSLLENQLRNIYCDIVLGGEKAIQYARENKYDLILMDLQMPEIDGFTAAKKIRKFDQEIPIIAYTSQDESYINSNITDTIFDDYLAKSISHDMLLKTVSKWTLTDYSNMDEPLSEADLKIILKDKKILLADDERINRMLFTKSLSNKYGVIVDQAENGQELLEKYLKSVKENQPYRVILADINMPILMGDEAAKKIRQYNQENNITDQIYIIAVSGDGNKEQVHKFLKSGIDDHFTKGEDFDILAKIVGFWMSDQNHYKEKIKTTINKNQDNLKNKLPASELSETIPLFIEDSNRILNLIKKDIKNNNLKKFQFHIHALKGISGNIGAKELSNLCSNLDETAKNNQWPKNKQWFIELEQLFNTTSQELQDLIDPK